jgi:hypothetical protein
VRYLNLAKAGEAPPLIDRGAGIDLHAPGINGADVGALFRHLQVVRRLSCGRPWRWSFGGSGIRVSIPWPGGDEVCGGDREQ